MPYDFSRKTVLVTGATSGIGAATAKLFSKSGASVFFIGRNSERGNALVDELKKNGYTAEFIQCDVANEDQVKKLSDYLKGRIDGIDVLINDAGVMLPSKEIERLPVEEWDKTFDINIRGTFLVTKVMKPLIYAVKGNIINIGSIAGMQSYIAGRSYAYSASKAAVIQFTRQMAMNYGPDGIRVNCICPGIIDTPILGDRDRAEYAKRVPLGYVGKPEEVAKVAVFLASDDASYITGSVLPVDGGVVLG